LWRALWAGADAAAVGAFGAGFAARSIPPDVAWSLQAWALGLPASSAAVTLGGVAWLGVAVRSRRRWPWALFGLHAALVVAAAARYAPSSLDPVEPADAPVLRVLTLNAGARIPGAEDSLRALLQAEQPTLVAFQESGLRSGEPGTPLAAPRAVMTLLGAGRYALARTAAGPTVTGQPVFATTPAVLDTTGSLDPVSGPASGEYNRVRMRWGGRQIAVYNVHLRSFSPDRPWLSGSLWSLSDWRRSLAAFKHDMLARGAEAEALRTMLAAEPLPYIVVGDMNATPDQWSYARVAGSLGDALRAARGWAGTFPDRRPVFQIDAVLTSPHWRVARATVAPPGLSDHRAVLVDLVLLDEPEPAADA
jgi:endonuclease/exonuclease/phosphatase (EEP) superfamily protein YafD